VTTPSTLPHFRYHPDPIATGSVEPSDVTCALCSQARGYIYTGPVHCEEDHEEDLCPWCIADGSAFELLGAEFTDSEGIGSFGDAVPGEVADEIAFRTPGFNSWQQARWFSCCGDGAEFLGPMGAKQLAAIGPAAIEAIRTGGEWERGKQWEDHFRALDREGEPTAYLFRCLTCHRYGGYSDFT
jgi:uncharacterized protein CbrC (UPF0167 family)